MCRTVLIVDMNKTIYENIQSVSRCKDRFGKDSKIVNLLGLTYTNNYGVRVLLSGVVECLSHAYENLEIRILDYGREATILNEPTINGKIAIKLINLRFSWKFFLRNNVFRLIVATAIVRLIPGVARKERVLLRNPWLKQIMEAKVNLSIAGGDSFSDIYGLQRLLYVTLPQILVLWLGKPLVLLPQTYGPFKGRISRCIASYIFRRAQLIYSRDVEGVVTVTRLLGSKEIPVQVIPDLGFVMEPEPVCQEVLTQINEWRKNDTVVGLNISKLLYMGGYTGNNMFGLKEDYPMLVNAFIDFLIRELKAFVLLIPHVGGEVGESEVALYRELLPKFQKSYPGRIAFIDTNLNHRQIKYIIGKTDVFTGSRMHACIAATSQCVPTVAFAYSDKFAGVMNVVRKGVRVVDLRHADLRQTCDVFREVFKDRNNLRNMLAEKIPAIKGSILSLFTSNSIHGILSK